MRALILIFSLDLAADRLISDESWEFLTQGNFSGGIPNLLSCTPNLALFELGVILDFVEEEFPLAVCQTELLHDGSDFADDTGGSDDTDGNLL